MIQTINPSIFLNRNSLTTTEEIAEKDAELMTRIMNMVRYTTAQYGSSQFEYISFDLYPPDEEKLKMEKINAIGEKIDFETPLEVRVFLLKNDFLIHIIDEALGKIREIFRNEKLKLVVETDPDMPSDFEVLSLKIYTEMDPSTVIDSLSKLNDEWWLEIKPRTKQKLIIEEEYV